MAKHGGLGKGLGALLKNTTVAPAKDQVQELAVADIVANRYQPRQNFDDEALQELKASIQKVGLIQPILVRKLPEHGYELIAGERRLRAAKLAGLQKVPAMVREYSDAQSSEIALIENIQREDLNAIEEAQAYARVLEEFKLTQDELASRIGRSRSYLANFLRLLHLDEQVQNAVAAGTLSMGQAKPLLALEDKSLQRQAAAYIATEKLSARQAEALVKKLLDDPFFLQHKAEKKEAKQHDDIFLQDVVNRMQESLGTKVSIHPGKKKSRLEIEFYSEEDLERIIEAITGDNSAQTSARNGFHSGGFTV